MNVRCCCLFSLLFIVSKDKGEKIPYHVLDISIKAIIEIEASENNVPYEFFSSLFHC